jgi:hypothetical protein
MQVTVKACSTREVPAFTGPSSDLDHNAACNIKIFYSPTFVIIVITGVP